MKRKHYITIAIILLALVSYFCLKDNIPFSPPGIKVKCNINPYTIKKPIRISSYRYL